MVEVVVLKRFDIEEDSESSAPRIRWIYFRLIERPIFCSCIIFTSEVDNLNQSLKC